MTCTDYNNVKSCLQVSLSPAFTSLFLLLLFYTGLLHCAWAYRCAAYEIPFIYPFVWSPLSLALVCFVGQTVEKGEKKGKPFAFRRKSINWWSCNYSAVALVCCDSIFGIIRAAHTRTQKICAGEGFPFVLFFLLNQNFFLLYLFIASWGWSFERCSSIRFRPGRIEENETVQNEINSDATWSQTGATLTNGSPDSSRSFTITKWPIFLILYLSFWFPFLFFFPSIHSIHSLSLPGPASDDAPSRFFPSVSLPCPDGH